MHPGPEGPGTLPGSQLEDPVRYRARWAKGRSGFAALLATLAALAALWALIPQPQTGAGSVDVTRLGSTGE